MEFSGIMAMLIIMAMLYAIAMLADSSCQHIDKIVGRGLSTFWPMRFRKPAGMSSSHRSPQTVVPTSWRARAERYMFSILRRHLKPGKIELFP